MAHIHVENGDSAKIIRIQGTLTIQDSSVLKEHLMQAFSLKEGTIIDLTEAQDIDLACIQVICSAHKTFFKAGKAIQLTGGFCEGVVRSLCSISLVPESCDLDPHGPCLWADGGTHE